MKHACLLIADAHQNMSRAVQKLLEGLFDVVVVVADGESLLEVSVALRPDLIIVDISLPFSGSGNILRNLRLNALLPRVKIIVLSIHDEVEVVHEMFAAGAVGFVLKCAAATDLVSAVSEVLQDRKYVSPAVQSESRALAEERMKYVE